MTASLLPLFVAVPVIASGLAAVLAAFGRERWARALAVAVPAVSTAGGVALVVALRSTPVLVTQVGGFVPGVAIPFVADTLAAAMLVATGLVAGAAAVYCDLTGEWRIRWVPALELLLFAGASGALLTGDLFNLFVFVEVMLMPSYALLALTGTRRRIAAGRLFVVVNLLTSTVLVAGVGLVYAVAGTVNIAALARAVPGDPRLAPALGIVVVALGIKAGAVPVHGWLPRAYPATSAGVMSLLAALHTKVALVAIARVWAVDLGAGSRWSGLLLVVALVTTAWGALASLAAKELRVLLAWQMVSGVGVILACLALAGGGATVDARRAGYAGALAYTVHHMLAVGVLLAALGAVEVAYGTARIERLSGLARRERATAVLVAVGIAALVGLPLTSGTPAKLEALRATFVGGGAPGAVAAAVILGSSLVGLLAMIRLWRVAFASDPREPDGRPMRSGLVPRRVLAPGAALAAVSVAVFLGYGALAPVVDRAATGLADPGAYRAAVLGDTASAGAPGSAGVAVADGEGGPR